MTPPTSQSEVTFEDISQIIWRHVSARHWHTTPSRALAISIALEASELLEHYQWNEDSIGDKDDLASELADVFIYAFQFAQRNNIDIAQAITAKLEKSAEKYPAASFKDKTDQQRHEAWLALKTNHNKKGL